MGIVQIGGTASGESMVSLECAADEALASAASRSGAHLVCRGGCFQCCIGVFPIAMQDGDRLRRGLASLAETDAERASRVRARVVNSLSRLDPWFPGDTASGVLAADYEQTMLFEEYANNEVCPALDPGTGRCDLYAARPVLCRTFGPPMRTEEGNLATCELCYIHATTDEIKASQLDPEFPAVERQSNAAYDAAHNVSGETLVAYALRNA